MPNAQPIATPDVFKYFWFLCAAFMAVNVAIWRRRLLVTVERGRATREEVEAFIRWTGLCVVGGPIALGLSELAAGWSSPFCLFTARANSVPVVTFVIMMVAGWAILLHWVWRGSGADFLGRIGSALRRGPDYEKVYAPSRVRTCVTISVIICMLSPLLWWVMPSTPVPEGCPIAQGTGR